MTTPGDLAEAAATLEDGELAPVSATLAEEIGRSFDGRMAAQERPEDVFGWPASERPLRPELQILRIAGDLPDPLRWGARAAEVGSGPTAFNSMRFLGESAAVLSWLAEPPSPAARQRRALEFQLASLTREWKMIQKITDREHDETKRAADEANVAKMRGLAGALELYARRAGYDNLRPVPRRPDLFDTHFTRSGGYGFFSMTSEMGSHPGFAGMRGDDRPGSDIHRAYLIASMLWAFKECVTVVGQWFDWELADELGALLFSLDALTDEIAKRFGAMIWSSDDRATAEPR